MTRVPGGRPLTYTCDERSTPVSGAAGACRSRGAELAVSAPAGDYRLAGLSGRHRRHQSRPLVLRAGKRERGGGKERDPVSAGVPNTWGIRLHSAEAY